MRLFLTAILFITGLIMTFNGASFLVQPEGIGPNFGLVPDSLAGRATVRADMTAFFLVCGLGMMAGAWRRAGDLLLLPAVLCGIAFIGRLVSLAVDGPYDGYWQPMLGEAFIVLISVAGNRLLPHHQVEELAG